MLADELHAIRAQRKKKDVRVNKKMSFFSTGGDFSVPGGRFKFKEG
ncbi:MAG: hypothetical protein WCP45_02480 [Verrucomicrobiota bacterium]